MLSKRCTALLVALIFTALAAVGQQPPAACGPVQPPTMEGQNIFTAEQEQQFGDMFADYLERNFRIIDDETLTAHMQGIVDRLTSVLPATGMPIRVYLTDSTAVNAWSMPGGRIYVTRKMVTFLRSNDELAGLLAHELGHEVTHQAAIELSAMLRQALGVSKLSDRQDIFDRYQQLIEAGLRDPEKLRLKSASDRDQMVADRTGMLMMARAGYSPSAMVEMWDRTADTKGSTGSWLSDMFGATRPEQKRLRELLKESQIATDKCSARHPDDGDFAQWQQQVVRYSGSGHKEKLHGVLTRTQLTPPLRGDIHYLRFSPDGKYILAQDSGSVWVLSHEPLASIFRIDAPDALHAQFTPDSQSIVFANASDRVEKWSIVERERVAVHDLVIKHGCITRVLSPDGKFLACSYLERSSFGLSIYDVETGSQQLEKRDFYSPSGLEAMDVYVELLMSVITGEPVQVVQQRFSPDARYYVAMAGASFLSVQLPSMTPVNISGHLKQLMRGGFAFLANGRVAAYNSFDPKKSEIISFPEAKTQAQLLLSNHVDGPTQGDFVIVHCPCRFVQDKKVMEANGFRLGLLSLKDGKFTLGSHSDGLDVYGDVFVNDRPNGAIGIYSLDTLKIKADTQLPLGPLTSVHAFQVSPDENWLAISEASRGAIWNLKTGQRVVNSRGFRGGYFGEQNTLWADVPGYGGTPRRIVRIGLSPPSDAEQVKLDRESLKSASAWQSGKYLAVTHYDEKGKGVSLEMRNATTGDSLWTHPFKDSRPQMAISAQRVVMIFSGEAGKREAQADASLQDLLPRSKKEQRSTRLVEVLDANTGDPVASLSILAGSSPEVAVGGDKLFVADDNRLTSYSLKTRQEVATAFGNSPVANAERGLLAMRNDQWHIVLSDLNSLAKKDQFAFASPVVAMRFSNDGSKLYVLTQDQTFFILSTDGAAAPVKTAMH